MRVVLGGASEGGGELVRVVGRGELVRVWGGASEGGGGELVGVILVLW